MVDLIENLGTVPFYIFEPFEINPGPLQEPSSSSAVRFVSIDNMAEVDEVQMETAIRVFAHYLGVDIETEEDLLPAVREAFFNLPKDWEVGIGEDDHAGIPYFYNSETGESDWKHPREEACFRKVRQARDRKRERQDRAQATRGRDNSREQERDGTANRRDSSLERPARQQQSVDPVEAFDEVEDLENVSPQKAANTTEQSNVRARASSPVQVQEVKTRQSVTGSSTAFGMRQEDFLDGEPEAPPERGHAATTGAGGRVVDHSMSPPLFKEMKDGMLMTPASEAEDPRFQRGGARQGAGAQNDRDRDRQNPGRGDGGRGWTSANTESVSVLGNAQRDEREQGGVRLRDYNSAINGRDGDRDRDRDNSNQRGRIVNDQQRDGRGNGNGGNGGRGGGRDQGRDQGRGAGRDQGGDFRRDERDRDLSRERLDRDRDAGRFDRDRDRDRDRGGRGGRERDPRDARDARGFEDESGGPNTHRSASSGQADRDRAMRDSRDYRDNWRQDPRPSTAASVVSSPNNHVTDRERELRAEVEKYKEDVRKLSEDNSEVAEKLASVRTKHASELATLRDECARLELRLVEERRERKLLEEQVTHAHAEHHSKARDLEDVHEIRLREAVRKARTETEEEYREKIRTSERRSLEEGDALRAEMALVKRKLEETQREADNAKRKITLSKQDGKAEAQAEADALRVSLREAEEHDRKQALEMRRLREECASAQGRLVAALQAVQVANAESDALRAAATTAVHDEQAHSGAVKAAMQRIQILDTDSAQHKAENVLLRRERDALQLEVRKLCGTAEFSGERLTSTETEARRLKAQAQAEVSRLTSRATELEALVSVLRGQLDQAGSHEMQSVRDVQRQLDSAEAEVVRLKDRLADREVKEESLNARIKSHEKELIRLQEAVFKKDRQLREEQEKGESIQSQIEAIRKGYESEVDDAKAALTKQKQANADIVLQQRREVERLEQEIAERVPEMVASAVAQVEARSAAKHAKELADQRLMSDLQREKLKQENSDLQAIYAEKEARQRLQAADEKVELEKLRLGQKAAQRRCEDLEEQVQELRRQLRLTSHNAQYSSAQSARRGGGLNRSMNMSQGPPPRTSLDFSRMLDQGFEGVRGSREGAMAQSFDGRYSQQEQNDENYYDGNEENAGEDALMSQTVSFINDQLAFMKRQIASSLQPRETPTVGSFGRAVPSASRTPAMVHSAENAVPSGIVPSSILSHHTAAHHSSNHVKFSPEALFTSPQSKHHRRTKAGDDASLREALRDAQEQAEGSVLHEGQAQHRLHPLEEVETLDEPRQSAAAAAPASAPMRAPAPAATPSSAFEDYSLDNMSYSYLDHPSGVSVSGYSAGAGAHNRFSHLGAGARSLGSAAPSFNDFSAISDGGYHEGYWRAKYSRTSKQQ